MVLIDLEEERHRQIAFGFGKPEYSWDDLEKGGIRTLIRAFDENGALKKEVVYAMLNRDVCMQKYRWTFYGFCFPMLYCRFSYLQVLQRNIIDIGLRS